MKFGEAVAAETGDDHLPGDDGDGDEQRDPKLDKISRCHEKDIQVPLEGDLVRDQVKLELRAAGKDGAIAFEDLIGAHKRIKEHEKSGKKGEESNKNQGGIDNEGKEGMAFCEH